jgi:outer membrane protein assembly factor BamA
VTDNESIYTKRESESLGLGIRYRWQFLTFRLDYAFKKDLSNWDPEDFAWGRFAFDLSQTF